MSRTVASAMCTLLPVTNAARPNPRLEVISSDDGFVVHDSEGGKVHYLNDTAAIVFSLCDGERDVEGVAALIQQHFGLDESPEDDVRAVVAQLLAEGVLIDSTPEIS
jgi:hypothetical protein